MPTTYAGAQYVDVAWHCDAANHDMYLNLTCPPAHVYQLTWLHTALDQPSHIKHSGLQTTKPNASNQISSSPCDCNQFVDKVCVPNVLNIPLLPDLLRQR